MQVNLARGYKLRIQWVRRGEQVMANRALGRNMHGNRAHLELSSHQYSMWGVRDTHAHTHKHLFPPQKSHTTGGACYFAHAVSSLSGSVTDRPVTGGTQ